MPCIVLTPFKHKNEHVNNIEPFVNWNQSQPGKTEQSQARDAQALWRESPKETQATERLYKGAPQAPGFLYQISDRKHIQ